MNDQQNQAAFRHALRDNPAFAALVRDLVTRREKQVRVLLSPGTKPEQRDLLIGGIRELDQILADPAVDEARRFLNG